MRLALLTGVAATLSFIGAAGAQAETIYVEPPDVVATAPGYVYTAPAPYAGQRYGAPRYVVTEPAAPVIAEPPGSYVVVAPQRYVAQPYVGNPPPVVVPREAYDTRIAPRESGIVTTGYSTRGCFIDLNGFERC